jgi:hypothetical protein
VKEGRIKMKERRMKMKEGRKNSKEGRRNLKEGIRVLLSRVKECRGGRVSTSQRLFSDTDAMSRLLRKLETDLCLSRK